LHPFFPLPSQCLALAASSPGSVLLQTSRVDRENYRSYLFLNPVKILESTESLFSEIEQALAEGMWVAGFFSYEYGELLQGMKLSCLQRAATPLTRLGVYSQPQIFNHQTGRFEGKIANDLESDRSDSEQRYQLRNLELCLSQPDYAEKVAQIHEYIRSGDTYQVNFTGKFEFEFAGSAQTLFTSLNGTQPVSYSAFLHAKEWDILSLSPELFFRRKDDRIFTRPMKGTAPRGADLAEDQALVEWLRNNPKNRSENVMIVDLLRNDLGRICEFGSIQVDRLFSVEKYETLFQMTSEISGKLRPDVCYSEIFQSLFPCGSITGAPKLRTMEIIRELEPESRGVYTGAIGFFSPNSEAVFSVPIRTLVLQDSRGIMGVGSGIVIDSQAEDEYQECLLKSSFLTEHVAPDHSPDHSEKPFQLLESILWHNRYCRLAMHLDRMERSATYFDFNFDRLAILAALGIAAKHFPQSDRIKVRMTLDRSGIIQIGNSPAANNTPGDVVLSSIGVSSHDRFQRHKTTRRSLYDQQYQKALEHGFVEVLFLNEREELAEGAVSNIFIERDGQWLTPPVNSGALPGIFRRHLLETKPSAKECVLHLSDLSSADAIYLCNSVRGLTAVKAVRSHSAPGTAERI
jgi:para-aminobenzoate synthetase/4-amino-4-deoxychorismate lyase